MRRTATPIRSRFWPKPITQRMSPRPMMIHAAESVIKLFRDHGDRGNRSAPGLKYVVHDWGVERFRNVLGEYLGVAPEPPRRYIEVSGYDLHLGWHPQGDGKSEYGLSIEYGRVEDAGKMFSSAPVYAPIVEEESDFVRNCVLRRCKTSCCAISTGDALAGLQHMLDEYGIPRSEQACAQYAHPAQHGLPRDADVRPGDFRSGKGDAVDPRRTRCGDGTNWRRGRKV